jgi:chromosome segregation ATPase
MNKETKEFIETSFEKWSGILVGEFQRVREDMAEMEDRLNHRMDGIKANLDSKIDTVRRETQETKVAVLRIEHTLQDKQEAQGDELASQNQRLERIEDRLGLPHSLSAAA